MHQPDLTVLSTLCNCSGLWQSTAPLRISSVSAWRRHVNIDAGYAACAGDGFSRRAEDSILHGCIPVIIMDDVDEKFSTVVDYSKFSVRIAESDVAKVLAPFQRPSGSNNARLMPHQGLICK